MKRAKIILIGITLFVVISGALAFKATRINQLLYSSNAAGLCVVPTHLPMTLQPVVPGQPFATITNLYYTTSIQAPCPIRTWYTIE